MNESMAVVVRALRYASVRIRRFVSCPTGGAVQLARQGSSCRSVTVRFNQALPRDGIAARTACPSIGASERAEPSATRSPVIDQDLYLPVVTDRRRRLLIAAAGLLYPIIISCSGSSTVPCSSFSLPSPLSDMSKSEANNCAERAAGPDRTAVEIVFLSAATFLPRYVTENRTGSECEIIGEPSKQRR